MRGAVRWAWLLLLLPSPASAWTPETLQAMAEQAVSVAPRDLGRQVEKHPAEFRMGVEAPGADLDRSRLFKNADGSGELDRVIVAEVRRAIGAIAEHRPFEDVVYQLGVVAHYVAQANNPLNVDDGDPQEGTYGADYADYVESARGRFAVVFYGLAPELDGAAGRSGGLEAFLERTFARGRRLYPLVGREYRRVGKAAGRELFDDRSTAFGVAGVAYSQAVTDIALVLRYIWLQAGGADPRDFLPVRDAARDAPPARAGGG